MTVFRKGRKERRIPFSFELRKVLFRWQQVRQIINATKAPERLRVCFDTEHAFAAGYDLRTAEGYERTFAEFDEVIGLDLTAASHVVHREPAR